MITPDTVQAPLMWASRVLNEAVMGFLALIALATAIGPLVFDVSPATERLIDFVERVVLGLFIAEFAVQFTVARDRSAWMRSPWRISMPSVSAALYYPSCHRCQTQYGGARVSVSPGREGGRF